MSETPVIIVGAGIAGLTCARELQRRGIASLVLERSRGVGGRCATRRVEGQPVDHGLPFLHVRSREFSDLIDELDLGPRLSGWPRVVREPRLACQPEAFTGGHRRWAYAGGMNILPRALARGLDVRLEHTVVALAEEHTRLVVTLSSGERLLAPHVVLAGSLPQSLRLLEPIVPRCHHGAERFAPLTRVTTQPVLTVLAGYALDTPDPGFDAWHPLETTMLQSVYHDSNKRESPRQRVLVIHSRPRFARERIEQPPEEWAAELLWEAGDLLGEWAMRPLWSQPHRWGSGRVRAGAQVGGVGVFETFSGPAALVVGDAMGHDAGAEGAFFSGLAAAEQIAYRPTSDIPALP